MKYKLVCFDLDGTLVDGTIFVWQTLHDYFQTDKVRRREAFEKAIRNEITYEEWFNCDLELLGERGATRDGVLAAIAPMRLVPGAQETLTALKHRGLSLAVISGSLQIVLDSLSLDHYFAHVLINRILFDDRGRIVGGIPTKFDMARKAQGLEMIAAKESIPLESTVFVGDNYNDVAAMRAAGLGIAFNCKSEELARVADVVVPGKDLREILKYIDGEPAAHHSL
jgi:phosphoserine phosphatase